MAATKTKAVQLNTNTKLNSFLSRGGSLELGTIAFDSAYPIGGESMTFPSFTPGYVAIEPYGGYTFEYDHTNEKIKAFTPGKSLIVEEVVTCASNVGTLEHKPFYILAVDVTATTTTGPYNVIPKGKTPLTKQCAVDFTTGGLTFLTGDAVTSVRVTYIPLHQTGPFSSDNLVIDEPAVAAAAKADLTYQAAAVQYIYDTKDGVIGGLEPVGEAPTATHKFVIDIDDGSNDTNIDAHADDEGNTLVVTYIKYAAFPPEMQIGDGDLTLVSAGGFETYSFSTNLYSSIALPGLGTQVVGEATATNVQFTWSGPSISFAAGLPTLDFKLNVWSTNEGTAVSTLALPIIFLNELQVEGAKLEVGSGVDLSGVSTKYFAVGF